MSKKNSLLQISQNAEILNFYFSTISWNLWISDAISGLYLCWRWS